MLSYAKTQVFCFQLNNKVIQCIAYFHLMWLHFGPPKSGRRCSICYNVLSKNLVTPRYLWTVVVFSLRSLYLTIFRGTVFFS